MATTVVIHVSNEDSVVGEVDDLPAPGDTFICIMNPRRMDGKDLHYLSEGVVTVIWPFHRINFIEIMPSKEEEEIIGFVRE